MAVVKFIKNSEKQAIYIKARKSSQVDQTISTGLNIPLKNWDSTKGLPKSGLSGEVHTQNLKIKQELIRIQTIVENALNLLKTNEVVPKDWLKNLVSPPAVKKEFDINEVLVSDYINDYYVTDRNKKLSKSTVKKLKTLANMIKVFAPNGFRISEMNNSLFISNFSKFQNSLEYSANYQTRNFKYIKTINYHISANYNYITPKHISNLKFFFEETDFVTLTPAEQIQIQNAVMPNPYQENAKKWLLISCLTGQRISDFLRFNQKMITKIDGLEFIKIKQEKTKKTVFIPISKKLKSLIKDGFPIKISDVNYNIYIKEVCEIAGLNEIVEGSKVNKERNRKEKGKFYKWELITSHAGRRSFATNNYGIIKTHTLMQITGHTTEKSFLTYINEEYKDFDNLKEIHGIFNN